MTEWRWSYNKTTGGTFRLTDCNVYTFYFHIESKSYNKVMCNCCYVGESATTRNMPQDWEQWVYFASIAFSFLLFFSLIFSLFQAYRKEHSNGYKGGSGNRLHGPWERLHVSLSSNLSRVVTSTWLTWFLNFSLVVRLFILQLSLFFHIKKGSCLQKFVKCIYI